jgi:hypothetical protein
MGFVAVRSGLRLLAVGDNADGEDLKAFMDYSSMPGSTRIGMM